MRECPVVETSLGKVKGRVISKVENGEDVFLYTGLPFAKPPVGELRFEAPISPEPWDGVLDATKHSPIPQQDLAKMNFITRYLPMIDIQSPVRVSEDCLYLSVYTANPSKEANLPVLLWIYGGEFKNGGESFYDGSVLASLHDVVVVIPNYRMLSFGFLSLGKHTDYAGNMGLLDQIMAMEWTQEHIQNFGGDPDNVTIFGESAGGMSVNYHVVSPLSAGLFHRAISHSGSMFSGNIPRQDGSVALAKLKDELGINENDPEKLIEILKSFPAEKLLLNGIKFAPVWDGEIFPKKTPISRKMSIVSKIPYMIGCNNTEGHGIMTMAFPKDFKFGISKESYESLFQSFIGKLIYTTLPDNGFDVITKEYEKNLTDDDKLKWSKVYGEIVGDTIYVNPIIKTAIHHVKSLGTAYMYVMTQKPRYNHDPAYGPESARKAPFCECDHADDIIFTMGTPLTNRKLTFDAKFSDDEKALSKEWMKYIVNFAKHGDPNVGVPVKTKWPRFTAVGGRKYMSVQQPCSVGSKYKEKRFKFWSEVVEPLRNTFLKA